LRAIHAAAFDRAPALRGVNAASATHDIACNTLKNVFARMDLPPQDLEAVGRIVRLQLDL
jgi:hypothetical protein